MRIAVISDIHGNLVALEAVLADIKTRGVDLIVNAGDVCTSPTWPRETFELLDTMRLPTVRGNHDRWVAELPVEEMSPAMRFTRDQLSEAQRNALGALPLTLRPVEGVLMFHGTPSDDYTYMLEELQDGRLALARPAQLEQRLEGLKAELALCGHSHVAHMMLAPNGTLIVNPGTVGCPLFADNPAAARNNARAPHARYATVTRGKAGRWSAEFHAIAYDWDRTAARALANGRAEWAKAYVTGMI